MTNSYDDQDEDVPETVHPYDYIDPDDNDVQNHVAVFGEDIRMLPEDIRSPTHADGFDDYDDLCDVDDRSNGFGTRLAAGTSEEAEDFLRSITE